MIDMTAVLCGLRQWRQARQRPTPPGRSATRTATLIYRHDRDTPPPAGASDAAWSHDMNFMLNKVVEEGTGKRALLDGIRAAGKTGTTNAYRDAWFVGFTGNLVAGVWFGNDDHTSMNNMTGGTLPATDLAGGHGVRAPEPRDPADPRPRTRDMRLRSQRRIVLANSPLRRRPISPEPCRDAPMRSSARSVRSSNPPKPPARLPNDKPTGKRVHPARLARARLPCRRGSSCCVPLDAGETIIAPGR